MTPTPADYHRIISSTLSIPRDTDGPVPVGLLACQRDPLLRRLDTVIISCNVSKPPPANSRRKKTGTHTQDGQILEVVLHDTVIFPEGGGQPSDTGIIRTADEHQFSVVAARRNGSTALHFVKVSSDEVDSAIASLQPGQRVTALLDDAAFNRRMDHASLHTGQHLLSACLDTIQLPTLSWSLTEYPSPCYVEIPRGMTFDEIESIQSMANQFVFEGRKVHVEVSELESVEPVPVHESGRAVGKALPQDYDGGVKRVVVIDGVDRNPCCGTHLPSLHNLQLFLLPHNDALSRAGATSARLYFLCGPRLIQALSFNHKMLTITASLMSCGVPQVSDRVSQVLNERKQSEKRLDDVEQELAKYIATDIFSQVKGTSQDAGTFTTFIRRNEYSANLLGFLSAVIYAFNDLNNEQALPHLIVLASTPPPPYTTSNSVVCIFGSDAKDIKGLGEILKSKLGVKGGGQGTRWSGKWTGSWGAKQDGIVREALDAIVMSK